MLYSNRTMATEQSKFEYTAAIPPDAPITKRRQRTIILTVAVAVLLISAFSVAASPYGFGKTDGDNGVVYATGDNTAVPYPTLIPIEFIKPTPKPTSVPYTHLPRPTSTPPPLLKPTPRPTITSLPRPSTTTPSPDEANPDRAPIDALCNFILYGGAQYAREAFPPEYLQNEIAAYGFAINLMGGEDAAIELVGEMIIMQLETEYGVISEIVYTVEERTILTNEQLAQICQTLPDYGMTNMPTKVHILSIKMNIVSDKGVSAQRIEPRLLYIDDKWYIHPADIDI